MKILWITNILFPEAQQSMTSQPQLRSSGGWMLAAAEALISDKKNSLVVATVSRCVTELIRVSGARINYYIIPYGRGNEKINKEYEIYWKVINKEFCPNVVHIHGTEFSHGYSYIQACGTKNVVISIQGILAACSRYYTSGISLKEIYSNITLRDVLRGTILKDKRRFNERSVYEKKMLSEVEHVIGRTSWDRAQVTSINPNVKYYLCNETLRSEFYTGEVWNYQSCRKYSIFLSQASYPIKGFHQLLKALPLILRHFPDTIVRVAGPNITKTRHIKDILHFSGYGLYIKRLIKKYKLNDKIQFIGNLSADEMKREYLNANIFICPSSVENSPNSLCEAQILGVPCLASNVGGIPDLMLGNEDNLYRFEDVEMLASSVCRLFLLKDKQKSLVREAYLRHDVNINRLQLLHIYNLVAYKDEC